MFVSLKVIVQRSPLGPNVSWRIVRVVLEGRFIGLRPATGSAPGGDD